LVIYFLDIKNLLQGDNVLIFDIQNQTEAFKIRMTELKNNALPGGWENTFEETIIVENIEEGIQYKLHGIELFKRIINDQRRKIHNLYVSDYRRFEAIRNDTLESILNFLSDRLDSSEWEDVNALKEIKKN